MSLPAAELRGFAHDAFFYGDLETFVLGVGSYVTEGLEQGETVLVATSTAKCEALHDHLGPQADVDYLDLAGVGQNPARIIPVWHDFLGAAIAAGRGARGVGEPVWPSRSPAELVECQHHETMLNLAFDDGPAWSLMCPYDVSALPPDVLHEAMRSHPMFLVAADRLPSEEYAGSGRVERLRAESLAPPTGPVTEVAFAGDAFVELRDQVARQARRAGISHARLDDLALAIHELATNSVRHGGGSGVARIWQNDALLVVEIADSGHVADPLAGRVRPALGAEGGRGLWMVNQLCDLVELRSSGEGTVVRVSTLLR